MNSSANAGVTIWRCANCRTGFFPERLLCAITDHGACFVGSAVMYLQDGTRDHFMRWLAQEYPHLVEGYERLYVRNYTPTAYSDEVKRVIGEMRARYGVGVGNRKSRVAD